MQNRPYYPSGSRAERPAAAGRRTDQPDPIPAPRSGLEPATGTTAVVPQPTVSAAVFNPPVASEEQLQQEIRALSQGTVSSIGPAGPVFGHPYRVRLLDLALWLFGSVEDLDLQLLQCVVELVHLRGVELELRQRERDLLRGERAGLTTALQQTPRLVGLEHLRDAHWLGRFPLIPH